MPTAQRLTPQPSFVVLSDGPLHGSRLSVDADEMLVGRRDSCELHVPDPHVSRVHAVVRRQAGNVWLEDLGSTGGTFVNGERLQGPRGLRDGDEVAFGTVVVRFEDREASIRREESTAVMESPADIVEELSKPALSPRQVEVLHHLRDGLTNPEIAERMGVTERTVKAHCQEVFDRLQVRNRTAAVSEAQRLGMFDA